MAGRTNRTVLRLQNFPMGRSRPTPLQSRNPVSPRKTKGVTTKPQPDNQKLVVDQLCQFLLGSTAMSDNVFLNCQNTLKKLEQLQADILKEVPWVKDLPDQNYFGGIIGLLLKEYQKQKSDIKNWVANCRANERLMEYKGKQIKELQNKHEIQILAKDEEIQGLVKEISHLKVENKGLTENNNKLQELIRREEEECKEKLQKFISSVNVSEIGSKNQKESKQSKRPKSTSSVSECPSSPTGNFSRETSGKSTRSDSDTCVSSVSFANSGISTVPNFRNIEQEISDMSELSFANSTLSELGRSCLLCSKTFNTTQVFLCNQCIDKFKIS